MKLELNRTHLTGYETVLDTTVFREETLETIVPDANPDILRLIDTQGKVLLKSREAMDGRVTLTGTARLAVLYQPEGGNGPCRLEVSIPFSMSAEDSQLTSGCLVTAVPRVVGADTRTINPRKILTRVEIAVCVKAFSTQTTVLCNGVTAVDGSMEQWKQLHHPYCVTVVQEKHVTFEDDLNIPAGRPAAEELLSSRVELSCHDVKLIGNKMILKGDAAVKLLYRPVGGGLDAADFTLPFSQIVEVVGVGEDGDCAVQIGLCGFDFVLGGDGRTVSAALSMLAQVVVREEREVELLTDAYSTCCPMQAEQVPYEYYERRAAGTGSQMVRQLIETGLSVQSVVDAYCLVGQTAQKREGNQLSLIAEMILTAVCSTEDGEYCAMSRRLEVCCPVEVPEMCSCSFDCRCGEIIATPTADGVEIRFPVDFPYFCVQKTQGLVVREMNAAEESGEEMELKPSIILRVMQPGERLWDVAKRYRTTTGDIIRANELESEQPCEGCLLLIPRKR